MTISVWILLRHNLYLIPIDFRSNSCIFWILFLLNLDLIPVFLGSRLSFYRLSFQTSFYNLRSYSGYLLILFLFNLDLILLYFLTDLDLIPSFIVSYSFNIWILFLLKFIKNSKSCLRSYSLDLILSTRKKCSIRKLTEEKQ